jgi:ELWxxDGT repeat protein
MERRRFATVAAAAIVLAATMPAQALSLESARFLTAFDVTRASGDGWEVGASPSLLFFFATAGPDARALWTSDGTVAGTAKIADVGPSEYSAGFEPQGLLIASDTLFFPVGLGDASRLWKSDGTAEGTTQVSDVPLGRLSAVVEGEVRFTDRSGGQWITDGTAAGTRPFSPPPTPPGPGGFTVGGAFFYMSMEAGHAVLWWSDGTPSGKVALAELGWCDLWGVQRVEESAFFTSTCLVFGSRPTCLDCPDIRSTDLWKTDGSVAGTTRLRSLVDLFPAMAVVGDRLIFQAPGGLWSSDGTAEGTQVVVPGVQSRMTVVAGRGFVTVAGDGVAVLWTTDGTAAGTLPLAEIGADPGDVARQMTVVRGVVFFIAQSRSGSRGKLWRTDGTPAGTRLVEVELLPDLPIVSALWNVHGTLLFATDDGPIGLARRALWALIECASGADCDDGDACTTDTCTDGVCYVKPLEGYDEVTCEVGTLMKSPLCGLRRLPQELQQCRATLVRLQKRATRTSRPAAQRRLLRRMDRELDRMARRATRPKTARRVGVACTDAVVDIANDLRALIADVPR